MSDLSWWKGPEAFWRQTMTEGGQLCGSLLGDLIPRTSNHLLRWVLLLPHYIFKGIPKQWKRLDVNPHNRIRRISAILHSFAVVSFLNVESLPTSTEASPFWKYNIAIFHYRNHSLPNIRAFDASEASRGIYLIFFCYPSKSFIQCLIHKILCIFFKMHKISHKHINSCMLCSCQIATKRFIDFPL